MILSLALTFALICFGVALVLNLIRLFTAPNVTDRILAVDTMTVGLAREVATEGIRVNAVAVGLVDTDLHAAAGEPGRPERIRPTVPMQRSGTVEEVAAAVVWLLSDAASYTTGTVLAVSGGR